MTKVSLGSTLFIGCSLLLSACASLPIQSPSTSLNQSAQGERAAFFLKRPSRAYSLAYQPSQRCQYQNVGWSATLGKIDAGGVVTVKRFRELLRVDSSVGNTESFLLMKQDGTKIDYNFTDLAGVRWTPESFTELEQSQMNAQGADGVLEPFAIPYPRFLTPNIPDIGAIAAYVPTGSDPKWARYRFAGETEYKGKTALLFDIVKTQHSYRAGEDFLYGYVLYEAETMIPLLVVFDAGLSRFRSTLLQCG